MRNWIVIAALLVVGFVLGSRGLWGELPKDVGAPKVVGGELKGFRTKRVEAARDVVAELQKRIEAGEPLTPEFLRLQGDAFEQLADSEIAVADNAGGRVAAAENYVERCSAILKMVDSRFAAGLDVSKVQVSQAKYQLADAQCMLAEVKAP